MILMHKLPEPVCRHLDDQFRYVVIQIKGVWWMPWHQMAMKDVA